MTFTEIETDDRADAKIRRDRWGRYVLPHPDTGKDQSWTRVTTVSRTLADRFALEQWDQRNVAYGLGQRMDLFARAAAAKRDDDETLTEIIKEAKGAAASRSAAVMGSAVHQFTERIDRGEQLAIPPPIDADVKAYRSKMMIAGIEIVPDWIERIVCVADLGIAGTMDRLVTLSRLMRRMPDQDNMWPLPRVGDVKTGKDVERWGMAEIPLQEGLYAHASHWWDGESWHEMPPVDLARAIIMHVPVGQGSCTLYEVDIEAGWEAVRLALDIREWRKRKDLCSVIEIPAAIMRAAGDGEVEPAGDATASPAPSPSTNDKIPTEQRRIWLLNRVAAIKAAGSEQKRRLAGLWSLRAEIPTFPKGGPRSDAEIDAVAGMCELVEMEFEMPFGASDPTLPEPTKAT
ncbi:MAG: hypothetical protein ACRD2A_05615 [Vicinamibacterales bacterium]